jgi:LysR family nitrogen assimilation transcriptional regulator
MDLKSIRYFVYVADTGSITLAAGDLGIVQPALSRQIMRLEEEAGAKLFERLPRGVQLTPAGEIYLDHCRRILKELALAKEAVAASQELPGGHVNFGVPGTCAQMLVPRLVEKLKVSFPQVSLRVIEGPSAALQEGLLAGRLHAAILNNPSSSGAFEIVPLISELLAVYCASEAGRDRHAYTLAEITRIPVIVTAGFRGMVDEQIRIRGKRLKVQYEVDSVEAIRRILLRSGGLTILPVSTLRDDVEDGILSAFPISDISMHRMLAIVTLRTELAPNVKAVVEAAQSETAALAADGVFSTIPSAARPAAAHSATGRPAAAPDRTRQRRRPVSL